MIIYLVTNKLNGKQYIGQTIQTIQARWSLHGKPTSKCPYLKNAIQKYGKDNFSISILASCKTKKELDQTEEYFIALYNTLAPNGYNLTRGGNNKEITEKTRKKMRDSHLGKKLTAQQKLKISKALTGISRSSETRAKQGLAKKGPKNPWYGKKGRDNPTFGKMRSIASRKKMSLAQLGKKRSPEAIAKGIVTRKTNAKK